MQISPDIHALKLHRENQLKKHLENIFLMDSVSLNPEKAGGIDSSRFVGRETSAWSEETSTHLIFVDGHHLQAE